MLESLLYVTLGAAVGGCARFVLTHASSQLSQHHGFPIGTFAVNVLGCFLVGYILTWSADHAHDRWRLLAATGFCGGFTTFSAFAFESMQYVHAGRYAAFAANVAINNVVSLLAVVAGIAIHRQTP
jgi:CrcB protein